MSDRVSLASFRPLRKAALFASAISVAVAIGGVPAGANELDPVVKDKISKATVYVKAKRHYKGVAVPSSGTGFFVHPDGLVLTNWHVVADKLQAKIYGDWRNVATEMKALTIVVGSGTGQRREIAAQVVAYDPAKDLAVLEVPYTPEAWLDITDPQEAVPSQLLWAAGYPSGRPLAVESNTQEVVDIGGPLSFVLGSLTQMIKDKEGRVFGMLTSNPIPSGFSGGPMVNAQGRVVGVVNPRISRDKEAGRAIAPQHLLAFTGQHTIQVEFSPPLVVSPPEPIRVTATPLLASLRDTKGTIRLMGDDIDTIESTMEPSGELWVGTIPPASRRSDRPSAIAYEAKLRWVDAAGAVVLARSYTLEPAATDIDTSGYVAKADDGQLRFADDKPNVVEERRVSEMAADVKVENVVLDDHNVGIDYEPNMAPERYQTLKEEDKLAARCYDRSSRALESMKRRADVLAKEVDRRWYDEDRYENMSWEDRQKLEAHDDKYYGDHDYEEYWRLKKELYRLRYRLIEEYETKVAECASATRIADILYCPSEAKWYYRNKVPCSNAIQP